MDKKKDRLNKEATSEITDGFLYALFNFYVSGYYLDLKNEKFYAIGQKSEYNDRYGTADDWARMDDYIRECVNEEDQPLITEASRIDYIRDRLEKEQSYSIEVRDHGTGEERWYRYTTMRGADADHAAISFMDVTDQVLARQEMGRLARSVQEELELNQTLGIYSWRIIVDEKNNMRYIEWSENACKFMEIPAKPGQHASMRTMYNIIHPDLLPAFIMELQKTVTDTSGQYVFEFDNKQEMKDGTLKVFHCSGRMVTLSDGTERAIVGAFRDITDSYLVKEEQQELSEVRDLMQAARWTARFNYDGTIDSVEFSDEVRKSLGYENEEDFPNDMDFWKSIMHPDDIERREKDMTAAVMDQTGETVYDEKYRLKKKDGEYLWVRSAIRIHRDDVGAAESAIGVFVDINDSVLRAQAEQHLREANEEQNAQLEEITALNAQLEENQTKLEESASEQEAQIEEITSLNSQLEQNQAELEASVAEIEEEREKVSEAYGMIEGLSSEYHTIWIVNKETSRMRLVRSNGKSTIARAVQMGIDEPEFDPAFDTYIGSCVEPEDRERMHREIAFTEVLRHLNEHQGEIYAVNYLRRDDSGHVSYHQIAFANADTQDGKKQFVYGFRDIDKIVKEEQRQKEELQKALNLAQEATEKQAAQMEEIDALIKAAAEYNDIMSCAGYGMWHIILKDGVEPRMQVNDKMAELLGVAGQDLSEEELYTAWYGQIVPDAIPSVQASVSEMIAGKFSENTYQWVHPTKGKIYVRCGGTCQTLEDGTNILSGYHADVTDIVFEEKKKKEELENIKNAALLENEIISSISKMYFAIFRIDLTKNYYEEISSDNSVHVITGHEGNAQEKMNELCASFVTDKYKAGVSKFFDLSTMEERLQDIDTIEYQYYSTNGNWYEARFIAKKRDAKGKVTHILYVTRVISEVKKKELEAQEALLKAKDAAEAANRAKSTFLFNMSHDIRTPMNAIIGYANLMKRSQNAMDKWPSYLDNILQSSDFLLGLINNVLEMARIESGKTVLDENVYSVEGFVDNLYSVFADEMDKKDLKFTTQVNAEHQYLYFDDVKLREIFLNILSNAQKYTLPGGSVDFTIKELPSDVDGYVWIEAKVADTGIGISEEFLPHLFEEFTREKNSSGNKIQGTGLGMPIVKKLIELMGGTIDVESKVGEGSTFIVTIPLKFAEGPDEIIKDEDIDYSDFAGKRILLAEDNDLNAEIAMEILNEFDFKVERAEDGAVCVNMLERANAGHYDLILMDIQMPNLDGYGAARKIRALKEPEKANIPIIAMTANAFEEDKRNALDAGMDGHVAKPIEIPVLMRTLAYLFKDRSAVRNFITANKPKEDPLTHVKRIYFEMQCSKAVSVLPGGFFAYMAEQPEKLIFANDLCCSIWGCKDFEEFNELVGGSFKGIVHPDDYERAEKEIWYQIDNGHTDLDQVKYRIIKKDGSIADIADYGRLVRDKEVGDIFYVFVSEIPQA